MGSVSVVRRARRKHSIEFKHEVCQYYDNHTQVDTCAKFDIDCVSLQNWRKTLGYRNKSRGYNLYTEGLQPIMQKREVLNFKSVRSENGDMKFELVKKEKRIKELEMSVEKYDQILSSIRQLFN
jgi:transposase-like protein|tara:strand:+ start:977 stop:1348 length:372 start_codon:yes stop_codon:yes gene_type:complete